MDIDNLLEKHGMDDYMMYTKEDLEYIVEKVIKGCAEAYHTTKSVDTPIGDYFKLYLGVEE